jgi:IS5 family transposase
VHNAYAFLHRISWDPYNKAEDPEISTAHKQPLSADPKKRNEVEGCFESGKRKYSLDLIMARLSKGAETLISMAFLVMCTEKILRLLCLFFFTICA